MRFATKVWLLLRLLPRRPGEFVDRLRSFLALRTEPLRSRAATTDARAFAQVVEQLEQTISAPLRTFLAEPELQKLDQAIAARRLTLGASTPFPAVCNADQTLARLCYALCRALRPATVMETGVAYGITSAFILAALEKNRHGELVSIDLPPLGPDADRYVGYLVPEELRGRWRLHRGSSRRLLPRLLRGGPPLDLFLHDSLHTAAHMTWEFEIAWPHLRSGGLLLSDDVELNRAFESFVHRHAVGAWAAVRQEEKASWFGFAVKSG